MIHLPKHCHMYVFYSAVYVTGANANKIEIIEARRLIVQIFHSSPIFLECQLLFAVYFFLVLLLEAQPEV